MTRPITAAVRNAVRGSWPGLLGAALVAHGLGHAVLPLRGAGTLGGDPLLNAVAAACAMTAIVGFVAAGVGALGVRPFDRGAWGFALVAATASLVGLRLLGDADLWPGAVLDVTLAVAAGFLPARRERSHRLPGQAAGVLLVAWVAAGAALWPWHRHWGSTPAERAIALPGDAPGRAGTFELMHGVSIDAPPDRVWPWLAQIGQDRAGFYSYDWLERAFLADIHNADEIRPEWQRIEVGDFVRVTQPRYLGGLLGEDLGWYVTEVQPGRALVLHHWGTFVLRDDGRGGTRPLVRTTVSNRRIPVWAAAMSFTVFELPHFIMQRRMLLGIKERAERARADG